MTFEPKLTLDGVMTLAAGIIAFIAVLLQNRTTRKQVDRQLDSERRARKEEELNQKRAVAVAMLFELDNFYRAYVRDLANEIPCRPGEHVDGWHRLDSPFLPPLRKVPSDPFPIYKANGSLVGKLPPDLAALVVRAYSSAQWVFDRVVDYQVARKESFEHGNRDPYYSFARRSIEEMVDIYHGAEVTLGDAMKELCRFADVRFQASIIAIAGLERIAEAGQEAGSSGALGIATRETVAPSE